MPRDYTSKSSRQYKRYDPRVIKTAIEEYKTGFHSITNIARKYNIARSVLHRHLTKIMKSHGGQKSIDEEAEKYIIRYLNVCSEWGYPLEYYDLRVIIKEYLDGVGLDIKKFNNNLPGVDYVKSFLKRHNKDMSERLNQNIKKNRVLAVSPDVIEQYFNELQMSLVGIPLCNIVNYDETNLTDDPEEKKIITKREIKYPERVMKHTKASTLLMMAASADGTLLPCYVVYKASNLLSTWTSNGPSNCRYNCTNSGWFDSNTFKDWVDTIALPYFSDKIGKKILIGDNLSSHLSIDIIRKCEEYNIHFIFLPPYSTHLTQPLDVAYFHLMKIVWRDILTTWKNTEGQQQPRIPKNMFPKLLKKMLSKMEPNTKQNILAGFAKSGINLLDKEKVLTRLPENNLRIEFSNEEKEETDDSVLCLLKEMRYFKPCESVEDSEHVDSEGSSVCLNIDTITNNTKEANNQKLNNNPTHIEKENFKSQKNLTTEENCVGEKTKIQSCGNVLTENPEDITKKNHIVNEHVNINYEHIDIHEMPIILDDNILISQEITIDVANYQNKFEDFLEANDNITIENTLNGEKKITKSQENINIQLHNEKHSTTKIISES